MAPSQRDNGKTGSGRGWGVVGLLVLSCLLARPVLPAAAGDKPASGIGRSEFVVAKAVTLPEGVEVSPVRVSEGNRVVERLSGLPGLNNVGRVAPGIVRGAQPEKGGLETLRKMGVRTVIDLRKEYDQRAQVEAAGMRYVHIPMVEGDVDPKAVREALSALGDVGCQPVYIHCAGGRGRTGTVVAAYRMEMQTWSLRDAKAEMQLFGVKNLVGKIKEFLDGYSSKERGTR